MNREKCEFSKHQLKFAGHSPSAHGIGPGTDKTAAIEKMQRPRNVSVLRRFLGMVNHQQEFPRPLRDLLSSKNEWLWGSAQEEAFTRLKKDMVQVPVLAHYCTEKETIFFQLMPPLMD